MTARLFILNPNATEAMTDDMCAIARTMTPRGYDVVGLTNHAGPPAIQGEADAAACLPGLFALARATGATRADALIIGCFDDTGLAELRAYAPYPVIGLGEAAMLTATLAAPRFAVLTTTQGSVPVIEGNINTMALGGRCDGVRAADIPVLDLPQNLPHLRRALAGLIADTGTGAVVLGCAGMGRLATSLAQPLQPPLIDPVRAAVSLAMAALQASVRAPAMGITA